MKYELNVLFSVIQDCHAAYSQEGKMMSKCAMLFHGLQMSDAQSVN